MCTQTRLPHFPHLSPVLLLLVRLLALTNRSISDNQRRGNIISQEIFRQTHISYIWAIMQPQNLKIWSRNESCLRMAFSHQIAANMIVVRTKERYLRYLALRGSCCCHSTNASLLNLSRPRRCHNFDVAFTDHRQSPSYVTPVDAAIRSFLIGHFRYKTTAIKMEEKGNAIDGCCAIQKHEEFEGRYAEPPNNPSG